MAGVLVIGPDADQGAAPAHALGVDIGLVIGVAGFLQGAEQTARRAADA